MATFDILLSSNQELQPDLSGKDFLTGDAENNYISYILVASPGHYKEFPTVGVGIDNFLNGSATTAEIERAIRLQLENDIFTKPQIDASKFITLGTITVNKVEISGD